MILSTVFTNVYSDLSAMKKNIVNEKRARRVFIFCVILLSFTLTYYGMYRYQQSRYVRGVYDCTDMTSDCRDFFNSIGIETSTMYGSNPDEDVGHVWLELHILGQEIPFESTSLLFHSKQYYRDRYERIYEYD